jgi:hypothetical protein
MLARKWPHPETVTCAGELDIESEVALSTVAPP